MSVLKSIAESAINKEVNKVKDRVNAEYNAAKNKILGGLGLSTTGPSFDSSLRYPAELNDSDSASDRTVYWLKIDITKQIQSNFYRNITKSTGGNTDLIEKESKDVIDKTIWLYHPGLTQNDAMNYDTGGLGFIGRTVAAVANSNDGEGLFKAIGSAAITGIDQATSVTADLIEGKSPGIGSIAAAIGIAKSIPAGKNIAKPLSYASGIAKDPHNVAVFQSVNLREFDFSFNFVPKNSIEANNIKEIIKIFRLAMYPIGVTAGEALTFDEQQQAGTGLPEEVSFLEASSSTQDAINDINLAYIFPNTFKLSAWRYNPETKTLDPLSHEGVFYKTCVLKSCNTTFNDKSYAQKQDNSFVSTTMSLSFAEIETLNRQDVRKFYNG